MLCLDKDRIGQWVAVRINGVFTPQNSSCIGWLDKNDDLVAGVWYENYKTTSIVAHIAIDAPITREFIYTIFHYPFVQLGVYKVIGIVNSSNEEALRLDKKFGFEEEARIKDAYPDGDMVLLTLTKDKCGKFLGERYGRKRQRTPTT